MTEFVTSLSLRVLDMPRSVGIIMEHAIHDYCVFFVAISVVITVVFLLLLFVSNWYKLCNRSDVIACYKFAED